MKYSQLVHMPGDVKQWLERRLEARGIDGVVYTKYLLSSLQNNHTLPDFMPPGLDSKEKYLLENLLEELCVKLGEFENGDSSRLEFSREHESGTLAMDPTHGFSYGLTNGLNCMEPIQPCLPPNSAWTRGLLHDSSSETSKDNNNKMEDYFSKLFYENPTDVFGFDFAWNKSDERKNGKETDRINFYNRQNLLATECSERLYERNADIDKLIAKFDAKIEDIWKTTSDSDQLNMKYQSFLSQNLFPNPYLQHGSNLIWAFGEGENGLTGKDSRQDVTEGLPNYKSSFSHWNKFSSPLLTTSNRGFDAMLNSFNVTLSNMQKWSAIDSNTSNLLPNGKTGDLFSGKNPGAGSGNKPGLGHIAEAPQCSQEEEDLLTSAKTHFRPIRAEELGSSQTGVYADGTTFAISNDLEKVSFKRSESGTLYLEADADTPRKYMEFKEKETGWNKGEYESDGSSLEEFVPKFRVRQNNEKCCQTDELDEEQTVPSMRENDGDSTSSESEEDEFYFPGDDELAQNIINAIEEEARGENSEGNEEGDEAADTTMEILEMSLYKTAGPKQCICSSGKEWNTAADEKKKQEWSEIWNSETMCDNCKNSEKLSTKDRFRFREELTREGEQLLLDLNCLQQMYSNSEWFDGDSTTESESNDEEGRNSVEEVRNEWEMGGDAGKGFGWWSWLIAKDEPMKNNFDLSRFWKEEKSLTNLLENDKNKLNETNERPLIADMIQKERKRRNSSSQKACNLYMEGQCRRPHCRFAHCDSAIPCPFFADSSCTKGDSCPLSHGARRPISL